ncbi:MAG TPA: alpha-ketoglutarate-dependent dioxygenase AlkB [Saprospiraceae bacterium]|nr:alpha-ketoglutarate-dependent dioxygenase AlkB [Saprospiraceae bacterium]
MMDNPKLFHSMTDKNLNILPMDGEVFYYGIILNEIDADNWFDILSEEIEWRHDEAVMFGKKIITNRKVAWYADQPFTYTYSNVTKSALPWTNSLLKLKEIVELTTNETYNSCLLNLYHNNNEGMAWHSDGEPDLKKRGAIASLTLGAERKFSFKHKASKLTISLLLEHGSLLLMTGATQENWLHRLPTSKKPCNSRINLTFRTIVS